MSYCTRIQSIVDEADKPDVIPLEAASHLSGCPECRGFADERAKLQELMAASSRVTVPVNFNALLNEKLSRVKAQKSSWLSSVGLMRIGTATAGLAVALIAVQYTGLFSSKPENNVTNTVESTEVKPPATGPSVVVPPEPRGGEVAQVVTGVRPAIAGGVPRTNAKAPRDSERNGVTILIVRDRDREVEVPMISVSLGMQQQVLNSSGRQQPRSSDISY